MNVLIAEDHALFRDALKNLVIQIAPNLHILETSKYADTLSTIENNPKIDLLILDLALPDLEWEEGLNKIRTLNPEIKIVVISASDDNRTIRRAAEYNIAGYIPKSFDPKILSGALKIVFDGGTYAPISAVQSGLSDADAKQQYASSHHNLTQRQTQVLRLVGEGKSNKQIAYEMQVSEATVKLHINALLRTLGVTNRTQAVITAQKMGLI